MVAVLPGRTDGRIPPGLAVLVAAGPSLVTPKTGAVGSFCGPFVGVVGADEIGLGGAIVVVVVGGVCGGAALDSESSFLVMNDPGGAYPLGGGAFSSTPNEHINFSLRSS